jgi:hypothetical protein
MTLRRLLAVAIGAGLSLPACGGAVPAVASPTQMEIKTMTSPPSMSRPPAPVVAPVEHAGVRYEQDRTDERQGDQMGGYLVALDAKTGARLWRLKVYEVPDHRAAGVSSGGLYFRSMKLQPGGAVLEIENEVGARFAVDLKSRQSTQIGGPPPTAVDTAPKPKPKPTPQ